MRTGRKDVNTLLKSPSKAAVESAYRMWLDRSEPWTQQGDSLGHTKDTSPSIPGTGAGKEIPSPKERVDVNTTFPEL